MVAERDDRLPLEDVRSAILTWFERHQRELPWRLTRDPYRVLVSEIMLQQTQVDRVVPYYERFLAAFPTVAALASAPTADVIRFWSGLGYNRRAVNLQRAARHIVDHFGGVFPRSVAELLELPGVGPYTAGAVACFAFEQDVSFLDTNMRRVVQRVFLGDIGDAPTKPAQTEAIAEQLVPERDGWRWNQALIEFGALQCSSRKPLCVVCPVQQHCRAFPFVQQPSSVVDRAAPNVREGRFEGSNRYFRGKIIETLRNLPDPDRGVTLTDLGRTLRTDFDASHVPWLTGVVNGLERDGLATIEEEEGSYDAESTDSVLLIRLP